MQIALLEAPTISEDKLWLRAALRECIAYGEHGAEVEQGPDGRDVCFNCGGSV